MKREETEELNMILDELDGHEAVRQMKRYIHHGRVTVYDHCRRVARFSWQLNRVLRLHADVQPMVRGAMLHDMYLYDWHVSEVSHRLHGLYHADTAAENARRRLHIGCRERDIILTHMWPLTMTRLPRSREAWIVCLADKYCSLAEIIAMR